MKAKEDSELIVKDHEDSKQLHKVLKVTAIFLMFAYVVSNVAWCGKFPKVMA